MPITPFGKSGEVKFTALSNSITLKFLPYDDDSDLNSTATNLDECIRMGIDGINLSLCTPPTVNLGNDTTICTGESLVISTQYSLGINYEWQDFSTAPTYIVTQPGIYSVELTNNCGSATDNIFVEYETCESELVLPNVFSPNSDHINDVFHPKKATNIVELNFIILNRWGQIIYETNEVQFSWDGTYNSDVCTEGVYFWKVEYKDIFEEQKTASGFLTLTK